MLLPHESTVAHEQRFVMESRDKGPIIREETEFKKHPKILERAHSQIPHVRPETPLSVTHNHDEDFSDDDSEQRVTPVKNGDKNNRDE